MIGLVLAGGDSSRFGNDKALYNLPGLGLSCAQLAVRKLQPFCHPILISASQQNGSQLARQTRFGGHTIFDRVPYERHGPLSGIIAATSHFAGLHDYLILAVDYPLVSRVSLGDLANHQQTFLVAGGRAHFTVCHLTISHQQVVSWVQDHGWRLGQFMINGCHCQPLVLSRPMELYNMNYNDGGFN